MKKIMTFLILMGLHSSICFSEENLFSHIDYPELQVTPRATERLAQLAALEDSGGIAMQWTVLASGTMTLFSGIRHLHDYRGSDLSDSEKSNSDLAASAGIFVGASWIAWGSYMGGKHWASSRLSEIKRVQGKDKRAELNRERLAEESLEQFAKTASTVDSLALYTNLAAATLITAYGTDTNRVYSLLAATTSLLPMLFPNIYSTGYEKHLEYKRKIYAPLVSVTFTQKMEPLMALNWSY
jgi:hypothetical protein